jgi:predicted XRE-type DNA-binding protein
MDGEKRKAVEAVGWHVEDVEDFLGLSEDELRIVELRVALSRGVRERREQQKLTQQQLAARFRSSQSRVAKIESGAPDVSLDLMFRGYFAAGGNLSELMKHHPQAPVRPVVARGAIKAKTKPKVAKG